MGEVLKRTDRPRCNVCPWHHAGNDRWYCPYGGPFTHYKHGYGPDAPLTPIEKPEVRDGQ